MTTAVAGTLVDFVLAGLGIRLRGWGPLTDVVPEDEIVEGSDPDVWRQPTADLFPAIRYRHVSTPVERGPRFGSVRVQVDEFSWPSEGGRETLAKIDAAISDVVGPPRARWPYRGTRFSVSDSTVEANEYPTEGPFRRARRLTIEVTPT